MNEIAIITSICGDRDILYNPAQVFDNADYYAFVEPEKKNPNLIWQQINLHKFSSDSVYANRRNAKIYKILPQLFLPGYKYYIWVDATHEVNKDPQYICETYLQHSDIAVFKHIERNCAYEEANTILKLKVLDHKKNVTRQKRYYKQMKFPKNFGLFELAVLVRRNTVQDTNLGLKWWEQICMFSSRDQISFPFCLWSLNITPTIMPGFVRGINIKTGTIGNNELIPQTRKHVTGIK